MFTDEFSYRHKFYHYWDAVCIVLLGVAVRLQLRRVYGWGLDIFFPEFFLDIIALLRASHLWGAAYEAHKHYYRDDAPRDVKPAPRNVPVNSYGKFVRNAEVVAGVRFDARKIFFSIVFGQLANGFTPDFTEVWWLRTKPRKWKGKDQEFRDFMQELNGHGLQKKNPNNEKSTYVVYSEDALRRKAGM